MVDGYSIGYILESGGLICDASKHRLSFEWCQHSSWHAAGHSTASQAKQCHQSTRDSQGTNTTCFSPIPASAQSFFGAQHTRPEKEEGIYREDDFLERVGEGLLGGETMTRKNVELLFLCCKPQKSLQGNSLSRIGQLRLALSYCSSGD